MVTDENSAPSSPAAHGEGPRAGRGEPGPLVWKLVMLGCAAIWGGSFVVIKGALDAVPAAWLTSIRFALATLLLAVVFHRRLARTFDRHHLRAGLVLGVVEGAAFVTQNVGLAYTTPGRNAFLTALYCVMVPFVDWALERRRPGANSLVAAVLAVAGVGALSLGGDAGAELGVGEWLTIVSAALFALQIVLVAHFAASCDVIAITVGQMAWSSVTALGFALVLEDPPSPASFTPQLWGALAYLVVLSSCVCFVGQNLVQAHLDPSEASLLSSFESVFAVIASVLFYGEVVTPAMVAGFALIFLAVLASELGGRALARRADT